MKLNRLLLLSTLLTCSSILLAQNKFSIALRNGALQPDANIRQSFVDSFNKKAVRANNKSFAVLQFETLPTDQERKALAAGGIELLDYVSGNAYTATIKGDLKTTGLAGAQVRSVVELAPQQKMQVQLSKGLVPSWAIKAAGTVDVWISYPPTFSVAEVTDQFRKLNVEVLSSAYQSYRILSLRVAATRLTELASLPFVEYVQPAPPEDQPLNFNSRYGSRANLLNAGIAGGGKGLNGEGVVVGIGDNADIQTHVDFAGRLINRAALTAAGHGTHVSGTVGGAGNINEMYRGYAPKATLISQAFSGIITNAPVYVHDHGMVITNNSYGDVIDCEYYGTYDLTSRLLDQMAFDFPNLENVFAAGNSGTAICPPFAPGYKTILGGYQSAKNVITVGATTDSGAISDFSSRGPVKDGRIKPEIVAMGQFVASTWPVNIYSYNNGTSMASPAVSGGLALMYQRYRQLNGGTNPKNGLMKALLCNGAMDRGNAGPDYQYGFGWLNLLRSVEMLEANHYFIASTTTGVTNTHTISVPASTAQLKVMLYWNDPAASLISSKTLVNDLDLQVLNPSAAISLPKILDTAISKVNNAATTGADHLNNMEQVVINNPVAGTYTLKVAGTAITQNPSQEYFLVYDAVPVQLKITAPAGGEGLAPSTNQYDMMKISWESDGMSGTADLEFSTDNGATWSTLASKIDINRTVYTWFVPDVATSQALVRITKNGTGESATSNPFTIVKQPVVTLDPVQCEGYITMNWTPVSGVSDYEVMILRGDEMKTVATTTGTTYTFSGLSKDSTYWITVRPRVNGKGGRRALAISRQPNSGSCSGTISDNDLKIDAILSPKSGRQFTSTQLNAATVVSIRVKNLDDVPATGFDVRYSINGGNWVSEHVAIPVAGGATYIHNFLTPADLSATGSYTLVAVVKNDAADPVSVNDTATTVVKNLANQPLDLSTAFVDNWETAATSTYLRDTLGLDGADRYDLTRSSSFGRARTFVNTGFAYSGTQSITLDADRIYSPGNTNYLYGTFNLTNYNALVNDLRLDFQFLNHGQVSNAANKVWIRGNETQPWIEVYNLASNQNIPGSYKRSESIEMSDLLAAAGQNFSTSFQVRWGQYGQMPAADKESAGGYTFDDIRLYQAINDMQMKSIDAPAPVSCGLTNASTIKVSVRNSSNAAISNVPVRYRVNAGNWVSETIPSIAGNSTVQYSFITTASMAAMGDYTIQAVVDLASDNFRDNDTVSAVVRNSPLVTSFPYLENFEAGDGAWFTGGNRSTWEYGTPTSIYINRAASGAKAWKTRLHGHYNDNELSYLYSPCFDISGLTAPTLSFSVALDIEDGGSILFDGAWVEYSADGATWTRLTTTGGTNWYNKTTYQVWSTENYAYWHVATASLPAGISRLRLRFALQSDQGTTREGIAVDDIHIYDNTKGIYDGVTLTAPVTKELSGNNWVDFTKDGKLIASVQPNNQNLGTTPVQAYISDSVRTNNNQYYHNRNITIKPVSSSFTDSVSVRFYFLDRETDSLIKSTKCPACNKPSSAYELGVSKYSDPNPDFENGTLLDNEQGVWKYIQPDKVVKVPFDKGYYAEFKVKDFSEFWLNNGGFDHDTPLPVKMMDFTAQKTNASDVLLKWTVGSEASVDRYEIEVAQTDAEVQAGQFIKVGEVKGQGDISSLRNYSFTDVVAEKFGSRYYRLKVINKNGSFTYSPVRSVVFEAVLWQVYPNPSTGHFYLIYQLNPAEKLQASVYDAKGRLVKSLTATASGFPQKLSIDLSTSRFAAGIYVLQLNAGNKVQTVKLNKL